MAKLLVSGLSGASRGLLRQYSYCYIVLSLLGFVVVALVFCFVLLFFPELESKITLLKTPHPLGPKLGGTETELT